MKKLIFLVAILSLVLAFPANAQRNQGYAYYEVQTVDDNSKKVTDINEVYIYVPDTTTEQTIYSDRGLQNTITQPMTIASTNTTLSNGKFSWWGPASGYDFSIGNDTVTSNNASTGTRTASDGRIVFPYYLQTISSSNYTDAQSITLGTDSDWVLQGGASADLLTFTPATNGAVYRVGLADGTKSADLQWYTASGVGLLIDEGADTFGITGLTTNINVSSNYATNINTGTSTGAVTIGSSTSGALTIDTTTTVSVNADDSVDVATTGAAADIDIDAAAGSVIVDGGEAAADAVVIVAGAGGVDITSAATFDIDITATGGKILGVASEAAADQFKVDATGTIAGNAINLETTDGGVIINADGAANGDITLEPGDDLIVTATDSIAATADNVIVTTDEAAVDQFKVDATGTGAGNVINLETTDGGVLVNADGAANGDIELNAADDLTLTAAGLVNISGSLVLAGIQDIAAGGTTTAVVLTNQVITVGADAGGDIVTIANGTAGQVLVLICEDATGITTITPATFGGGTSITFNALGETITLVYTAGTGWNVVGGNAYTII